MSRFATLFLTVGVLLTGCAGRRLYYDREIAQNGSYHSCKSVPTVRGIFSAPNQDREFRGEDAVLGVLTSAFMLVQNPDYYQKSSIGGRCVHGPEEAKPLQMPCMNVTFVLTDETGKEAERIYSESGSFQFYVEPSRAYFVSVLSGTRRHRKVGPVRMGDEVVIRMGGENAATNPVMSRRPPGRS